MQRKTRRLIGAVALIAALAAGGAAFTLGNTVTSGAQTMGFYNQQINAPGTATSVSYGYTSDKSAINQITVNFTDVTQDMTTSGTSIKAGFDGSYQSTTGGNVGCSAGALDSTTDPAHPTQVVTCNLSATPVSIQSMGPGATSHFNMLVTNP